MMVNSRKCKDKKRTKKCEKLLKKKKCKKKKVWKKCLKTCGKCDDSECDNYWTCCSSNNPCNEKEGDCDTNDDCINDLTCGVRNCGPLYPANSACCESEGREP